MGAKRKAAVAAESFDKESKDKHFCSQCQTVYQSFRENPKTMFQVEIETGIPRPYICWYVRDMRKRGNIQVVKKGCCPISKWDGVGFYSTDPALFNKLNNAQLNLFEDVNQS
ncbi:hypothetical protein EZS27_023068 [termite gut metagenome]|uniref:Uncharacterized protein n=1 Tax=termite gut metagenome TaxID=433724 RepID=A0A5J4R5Z2_9ZZZZ